MNIVQFVRRSAAVLSVWLMSAGLTAAQDTTRPWAFLSPNANLTEAPTGAPPLDLRTNVTQPVYLYLVNPTEDVPSLNIIVKAGAVPVATAEVAKAPIKGKPVQVLLKPVAAVVPPPAPGTAVVVVNTGIALPPTLELTVEVANKNKPDEAANEAKQTVKLLSPSTFLGESTAKFFGTDNTLVVTVKANDFQGPPCPVELVIGPNDVPGLVLEELKGVTRGVLSAQQKEVTLTAAGLAGATGEGLVSLTVGGIERAVVFRGDFKIAPGRDSGPFVRVQDQGLGVFAPKIGRPGQDIPVRVAVQNVPDSTRLTLTFGQGEGVSRVVAQTFTHAGPRDVSVTAKAADDGALGITTVSKEWVVHPDTRGIYGVCTLKASMDTGSAVKDAIVTVTLDDTPPPPTRVAFEVEPGKRLTSERGTPLLLRAIGEDPDSGIAKVEFFVGAEPPAPGPDGKFPPEPKGILAEAVAPTVAGQPPTAFAAKLEIAVDKKVTTVPVFVRFTNGVGLSTTKKTDVEIVEPPAGGWIKGQVFYGSVLQKKATLTLYTPKWEVVKVSAIDKDGNFEFKDLAPGDYRIGAEDPPRKLKGYTGVTVKASKVPTEVKLAVKVQ